MLLIIRIVCLDQIEIKAEGDNPQAPFLIWD